MPKETKKSKRYEDYEEDDDYYDVEQEEPDLISPGIFKGDAGEQNIQYMVALLTRQIEKQRLSKKRDKGKAPSSEHHSHGDNPLAKRQPVFKDPDNSVADPTFDPEESLGRGRGRGRARGVGRGRGRGRAKNVGRGRGRGQTSLSVSQQHSVQTSVSSTPAKASSSTALGSSAANKSANTETRGKHWRKPELRALIWGANYLKPVLKGRFKHGCDGVTLKDLGWEELSEYVESIGKRERSVDQCRDKLSYFGQETKKKRQRIDGTYTTGSAAKKANDLLEEEEQAILDWIGEDVTKGIPGMQPPNLQSGQREDNPWSCYDPIRDFKFEYTTLRMPSSAMTAAQEGNLLEDNDVTSENPLGEEEYNRVQEDREVNTASKALYDELFPEEGRHEFLDTDEETLVDTEPPLPRVSRSDMMQICDNLNQKKQKQAGKGQAKTKGADVLILTDPRQISKKSLLDAALEAVRRQKARDAKAESAGNVTKPSTSSSKPSVESTSVKTAAIYKTSKELDKSTSRRKPSRTPSFSQILNESDAKLETPPDSPDPPDILKRDEPRLYTKEEIDALIRKNRKQEPEQNSAGFSTSTPKKIPSPIRVDSDIAMESPPHKIGDIGNKSQNLSRNRPIDTSALGKIERIAVKTNVKKRKLFSNVIGGTSSSPPAKKVCTEESLSQSIKEDIARSDLNSRKREFRDELKETQNVIVDFSRETAASMKDIVNGMTVALREHAHDTAVALRSHRDQLFAAQKRSQQEQTNTQEENSGNLADIHTKLTERIITKEVKMVQGLERTADAVMRAADKIAASQNTMITGVIKLEDVLTKLSGSMSLLVEASEAVQASNVNTLNTVKKADDILGSLVNNMERMTIVESSLLLRAAVSTRTVHVTSVETQVEATKSPTPLPRPSSCSSTSSPHPENNSARSSPTRPERSPPMSPSSPKKMYSAAGVDQEVHEETANTAVPNTTTYGPSRSPVETEPRPVSLFASGSFFLTHPGIPEGNHDPIYRTEQNINMAPTTAHYILPACDILNEESQEERGLPEFTVLKKEDIVFIQDGAQVKAAESTEDAIESERILRSLRKPVSASEAETEGSVSDRTEGAPEHKRPKRIRKLRIKSDF